MRGAGWVGDGSCEGMLGERGGEDDFYEGGVEAGSVGEDHLDGGGDGSEGPWYKLRSRRDGNFRRAWKQYGGRLVVVEGLLHNGVSAVIHRLHLCCPTETVK